MRDMSIHRYFGVDLNIVRDVKQTQLAPLGNAVEG